MRRGPTQGTMYFYYHLRLFGFAAETKVLKNVPARARTPQARDASRKENLHMRYVTSAGRNALMFLLALAGFVLIGPRSSAAQEKQPGEQVTCTGPILLGEVFPLVQVYDVAGGYVCLAKRTDRDYHSVFSGSNAECLGINYHGKREVNPQCRIIGTVQEKQYTVHHQIVYRLAVLTSATDVEELHPEYRVGERISCSGPLAKHSRTSDSVVRVQAYDIVGGYDCSTENETIDPLMLVADQCALQDGESAFGWQHALGRCRIDGIVTKIFDDDHNHYVVRITHVSAIPK